MFSIRKDTVAVIQSKTAAQRKPTVGMENVEIGNITRMELCSDIHSFNKPRGGVFRFHHKKVIVNSFSDRLIDLSANSLLYIEI